VGPLLLGYSGLDINSYAAAVSGTPRHEAWFTTETLVKSGHCCSAADGVAHDHHQFNVALYEAALAVDLIRTRRSRHGCRWTSRPACGRLSPCATPAGCWQLQ
jgi:hypothetical protein